MEDAGRLRELKRVQDRLVVRAQLRPLRHPAIRGDDVRHVNALQRGAKPAPSLAGRVLGHAHGQQGQPAEEDVGADPVFKPG